MPSGVLNTCGLGGILSFPRSRNDGSGNQKSNFEHSREMRGVPFDMDGQEPRKRRGRKEKAMVALEELKRLLGKQIRIAISDGRVIEGEFQCMDGQMNFIVNGATEYHGLAPDTVTETLQIPATQTSRSLGMVMVPGKAVVKCFIKEVS